MAASQNVMRKKVERLTNANTQREKQIAALMRELAELREEKAVMVKMFQEQLNESRRKASEFKEEEAERAADLAALQEPVDDSAISAEVVLLQEELERVKLAGQRRLELKYQEVAHIRADVEQSQAHLTRLTRASRAIGSSADADLSELEMLRTQRQTLESQIEDLESENLKLTCQVDAWGLRLGETKKLANEASEWGVKREADLTKSLEAFKAYAVKLEKQLKEAKERCDQLKLILDGNEGSGSVRECGVQTKYLTEQTRLREQVDKLTQELDRITRASNGETSAIGSWLTFCLRPGREDTLPSGSAGSRPQTPRTPRALSNEARSARRPLVV